MTASLAGDAAAALTCAIRAEIVRFMKLAGRVTVDPVERSDWASVTFTGARHRLRARVEGEGAVGAAADFLAVIGDIDLHVPGQFVADLALVSEERGSGGSYAVLDLEALTIDE